VTTSAYLRDHVIPAAYAILPPKMASREATALLLAIALQESRCDARCQHGGGPAHGFWQFERGGVAGVMKHGASARPFAEACLALRYPLDLDRVYRAIEHNDVLAAVCARLLLWTLPAPLPAAGQAEEGWRAYLSAWRPGKPHRDTWDAHFASAWAATDEVS
jgi:hypothetical protein